MFSDPSASSPSAPIRGGSDERLLSALKTAVAHPEHDGQALRNAVFEYVVEAKTRLLPPQEVLIALKAQVQRAAARTVEATEYRTLVARVVQWGIEEYYRGQ